METMTPSRAQGGHVSELADGKVGGTRGLASFLALDADACRVPPLAAPCHDLDEKSCVGSRGPPPAGGVVPMLAAWIIGTSFAPSPIASVRHLTFSLTSRTTLAWFRRQQSKTREARHAFGDCGVSRYSRMARRASLPPHLLDRRDPTANDGAAEQGQLEELVHVLLLQRVLQGRTVDHQGQVLGARQRTRADSEAVAPRGKPFAAVGVNPGPRSLSLRGAAEGCTSVGTLRAVLSLISCSSRSASRASSQLAIMISMLGSSRWADKPMLMAVSCLSPVSTHSLMPAWQADRQ